MGTKITTKTRITKGGFVGVVTVRENGRYLWSESALATRTNCIDALRDARECKAELLASLN